MRPVARILLQRTLNRQSEVGNKLYATDSKRRALLIEHLMHEWGRGLDEATQHWLDWLCNRLGGIGQCRNGIIE